MTPPAKPSKAAPPVGLATGLLAVSFAGVLIKLCGMNPFLISALRTLAGGLILLPFALKHMRGDLAKLTRREMLLLAATGLIMALHFVSWVTAAQTMRVGSAMMIFGAQPVFAGIVAHFFLKERFAVSGVIALALALAGIAIIGLGNLVEFGNFAGTLLALVGAITMASILCSARVLRRKLHIMTYAASIYLVAGLALAPSFFFTAGKLGDYAYEQWIFMALIVLVPQLMGHTMLNWAMKHYTAFTVNLSSLIEPVLTAVLALVILHERQNELFVLAGALILGGMAYHLISEHKRKQASANKPLQIME